MTPRRKKKLRRWRVLIVGTGSLLEQGIESLLAHEVDIHVLEVIYTPEDTFMLDILQIRPDVIVFHEVGPLNMERIFELLRTLPEMETLRVIILRSANTTIDFYERRTVNTTRSQDFLNLVRGRFT